MLWDDLMFVWLNLLERHRGKYTGEIRIFACSRNDKGQLFYQPDRRPWSVILDCPDDYSHLTTKTILARKHIAENMDFDYMVKVDSDVVFNFDHFFYWFQENISTPKPNVYAGIFWSEIQVIAEGSKWADPELAKILKFYPKYAGGGGYMLSSNLVIWMTEIENLGAKYRKMFNEDTFVGLMLASRRDILYLTWNLRLPHEVENCEEVYCHQENEDLKDIIGYMKYKLPD